LINCSQPINDNSEWLGVVGTLKKYITDNSTKLEQKMSRMQKDTKDDMTNMKADMKAEMKDNMTNMKAEFANIASMIEKM